MLDFLSETDREIIAKQNASLEEVRIRLGQKAKAVFAAKGKRYVVSLENIYDGNLIEEIVNCATIRRFARKKVSDNVSSPRKAAKGQVYAERLFTTAKK